MDNHFIMANGAERELPVEFAFGLRYFNEVLLPSKGWFQAHEGKYVAVFASSEDEASDPHELADRIGKQYPRHVLYMPHVVRLSPNHPVSEDPKIPQHMVEAEKYYEQVLRNDATWLRDHLGTRVAIIGRQVVGEAPSHHELSEKIREVYGYDAIFMTPVTNAYPLVYHMDRHIQRA